MTKEYKFDAAFSFLAGDSALAVELADEVAETNEAFVFPRNQEELAGQDGVEKLKMTYGIESRVVVILYRDKWGQTPWTGVEKEAIADRALREQQDFLLVVALDPHVTLPEWISPRRVYWHFPTYGKAGLAGAIRVKIAEMDGKARPESPLAQAQRVARIHQFERVRKTFRGDEGASKSLEHFAGFADAVEAIVKELNGIDPQYQIFFERRGRSIQLIATNFSILVSWQLQYTNSLESSKLEIVCFHGRPLWPDSPVLDNRKTGEKWKKAFDLDLLLPGQPGWRRTSESLALTSQTLAEYVISALLKEDGHI